MGTISITRNPNQFRNEKPDLYPVRNVKKYLNGSCKVVQNISEPEVLLTEPKRVTRKTKKSEKISEETDPNVQNNIQYNYMKHEYILQILNFQIPVG